MKTSKKWIWICALVCAAAVLGLFGYRWRSSGQTEAPKLIYIPKTADGTNDFWTSLISGTRTAAEEFGADFELYAPPREQDVERQNELLAQAIEEKPDAILISPSSVTETNELLKKVKDAGIALTFVDSYTEEELQDITVATDNVEAGKMLGEFARSFLEPDAKIAIVSHVQGVSTATDRERGFREGLGDLNENVVEVVFCNSLFDEAYRLANELMEKYPDLQMIAGMNEYSAVGAARAVRDAGAGDQIVMVGIDSSQEAVQLMEQGIFRGLVVQKPFKMGYLGVQETLKMLRGEEAETNLDSGCELVTPENMYDREIEKLLFPFYADVDSAED